jgi:alkaline phosphatase
MKTYSTDKQVPDSVATATAMFSGVNTRSDMLGLDEQANYSVCDTVAIKAATVESIADWGTQSCKEVGIVSTARITHATPAAMYAHSRERLGGGLRFTIRE